MAQTPSKFAPDLLLKLPKQIKLSLQNWPQNGYNVVNIVDIPPLK